MASPRPYAGIGMTAMAAAPAASSVAQRGEQVGGGLGEIAGRAEVDGGAGMCAARRGRTPAGLRRARTSRASRRSLRRGRVVARQHAGRGRAAFGVAGARATALPSDALDVLARDAAEAQDDGRRRRSHRRRSIPGRPAVAPPSRIIGDAVAEIGCDVRGRRRADMAGAVGAGRGDGHAGGAQQRLRDRDAPGTRTATVSRPAVARSAMVQSGRLREHQRQRPGPEGVGERARRAASAARGPQRRPSPARARSAD